MKAYNIRLYPNLKQQKLIDKTCGCARFVYNHTLSLKKDIYEECYMSYTPNLKSFKEEWPFLKEVSSQAICNAFNDCLTAFKNFFKSIKGDYKSGSNYPKFKKKGKSKDSYRIACTYDKHHNNRPDIKILNKNHIVIPKLGIVKFSNYKDLDWSKLHIVNITITKSKQNKYYCSVCSEVPEEIYKEPKYDCIAFDLGLKDFAIFDTGEVIENPKYYRKKENKLAKEQRKLNKCKYNSGGYKKQKLKVAKIHEKIKNQRKDFHHKWSSKIVNENQVIISENLNIKGMLKNHNLAKSISDASWGQFLSMIKYKSDWKYRTYIKIDRFFPSSKQCHHCGYKYSGLKLEERYWICPICGKKLDRDENAAINILNEGLRLLQTKSTVEYTGSGSTHKNEYIVLQKTPKPIDTGLVTNLESEQLNNMTIGHFSN